MLERLDAAAARRWAVVARSALAQHRGRLDALNVYPVPDGDTGTNLYLTLDAALDLVQEHVHEQGEPLDLSTQTTLLADSLLRTARGNSGVLLGQLVRGFAVAFADLGGDPVAGAGPEDLTRALESASDCAVRAVAHPVEGTVLTVARAAAEGARAALDARSPDTDSSGNLPSPAAVTLAEVTLADVTLAAVEAARAALVRTTDQLEALRVAGVVDSGAAGWLLVLEALRLVVEEDTGTPDLPEGLARSESGLPAHPDQDVEPGAAPAFEVMFLLDGTDPDRVEVLRSTLDPLGDSLLVVGGPDLWNVHVHVDDPGAAVEAGIVAGRPHRVRITTLDAVPGALHEAPTPPPVAVVALAAGPGLAALFEDAGATALSSTRGQRAGASAILAAVRSTGSPTVVVLPNSRPTREAAFVAVDAAAAEGVTVQVVPTRAAVQVIAALAVHDPHRSVSVDVVAMADAAGATRDGAVAVATSEGLTSAGRCGPGDVLGIVHGDVVVLGSDLVDVAVEVAARLLSSGGELMTVVTGEDAPEGIGLRVESLVRASRRDLEVVHVTGGQPAYALLLGVE